MNIVRLNVACRVELDFEKYDVDFCSFDLDRHEI